jgi:hypothetical protein
VNRIVKTLVIILCMGSVSCAGTETSNLESARFALDREDYTSAIVSATAALAADSTNIEAARVLASAYLGRSGISYLDLAEGILDLSESSVTNLSQIADVLPATATMSDVRSAIVILSAVDGIDAATITDEGLADAAFDLGILMVIEHFAIGVYSSNQKVSLDVSLMDDTDRSNVQADLVSFDNRLVASGLDATESFLSEIRQTFCILEPISAAEGFTLAEYQDYVGCQLSADPTTFVTTTVADCDSMTPSSQTAAIQACYDVDTSL